MSTLCAPELPYAQNTVQNRGLESDLQVKCVMALLRYIRERYIFIPRVSDVPFNSMFQQQR